MQVAKSELMTPHQALAANGKSFNWARRFLGRRMGGDAATLYRFCRVLDDMADGDIVDGPRRPTLPMRQSEAQDRRQALRIEPAPGDAPRRRLGQRHNCRKGQVAG